MDLPKALALLKKYEIPFAEIAIARNKSEAVASAKKLGFPVALKVFSKEILHKSDIGGVKLNIQGEQELEAAYDSIMKVCSGKKCEGVLAQKMARRGVELIVGGKMDAQFGPLILFGLGGIYVEVLRDVSTRVCPISREDAKEMISEIRGKALLEGVRGGKPVDKKAIEDLLVNTSKMLSENNFAELDLNPVIAYEKGCLVVDIRVIE